MLKLSVKIGEAVQIGDVACVGVDERKGQSVYLTIATARTNPVRIIPSGIIPREFTTGITGERRPSLATPRLAAVG